MNAGRTAGALITVAAVALAAAPQGRGQSIGFPIADTAEARQAESLDLTAAVALSDRTFFGGIRETYAFTDAFRLLVDAGLSDYLDNDLDFGMQVGGLYTLPVEFWADLAFRGAVYGGNMDRRDTVGLTGLAMASGPTFPRTLYLYGGLGLEVVHSIKSPPDEPESTRTEVNPLATAGAMLNVTPFVGIFVEVTHTDNTFLTLGVRVR